MILCEATNEIVSIDGVRSKFERSTKDKKEDTFPVFFSETIKNDKK